MNEQRRVWLRTASLLALLIGMMSGCVSPSPAPTPTPTPTPTRDVPACQQIPDLVQARHSAIAKELGLETSPYEGLMYVPRQLVLTGLPEDVEKVASALEGAIEAEPISSFDIVSREEARDLDLPRVTASLYRVADGVSVEEVLCLTREAADELDVDVAGDPNWYLTPAGEWAGGASPWSQNGDWKGVDGGGIAVAGDLSGPTGADVFTRQWALSESKGIGLYDANGQRVGVEGTGSGVRVGVFDTSPYGEEAVMSGDISWREVDELMGALGDELPLYWAHPELGTPFECPAEWPAAECKARFGRDIRNHGLFVAGLIHAVAPESEIHLVRVLEDNGYGSLFSIAQGIQTFVREMQAQSDAPIVVNLSLGVNQPRDVEELFLHEEIQTLATAVFVAQRRGALIVAAAGNDSFEDPRNPRAMELPAAYDCVIGVSASNSAGARGCFSNTQRGALKVLAPGGDGVGACQVPGPEDCAEGDYCLVGLSIDSETGHVYWVGTSFAAPLVSGQVALILSNGGTVGGPANPPPTCGGIISLGACPP